MAATALELRSPHFESIKVTTPTAGYTAGQLAKIGDTVGVIVATTTVGQDNALINKCEKIVVPKSTGAIAQGAKVYYDAGEGKVNTSSTGNTLCGVANVAGATSDTTIEINLGYIPA